MLVRVACRRNFLELDGRPYAANGTRERNIEMGIAPHPLAHESLYEIEKYAILNTIKSTT